MESPAGNENSLFGNPALPSLYGQPRSTFLPAPFLNISKTFLSKAVSSFIHTHSLEDHLIFAKASFRDSLTPVNWDTVQGTSKG